MENFNVQLEKFEKNLDALEDKLFDLRIKASEDKLLDLLIKAL